MKRVTNHVMSITFFMLCLEKVIHRRSFPPEHESCEGAESLHFIFMHCSDFSAHSNEFVLGQCDKDYGRFFGKCRSKQPASPSFRTCHAAINEWDRQQSSQAK